MFYEISLALFGSFIFMLPGPNGSLIVAPCLSILYVVLAHSDAF